MLQPERVVRNRFHLARALAHPALTPGIDDPVLGRRLTDERQRDLKDDGVDVPASLRILAAVDKAEIAVLILLESIAVPGERARRKILLQAVPPGRVLGIEIEEVVSLQLENRLGNLQFSRLGHRV